MYTVLTHECQLCTHETGWFRTMQLVLTAVLCTCMLFANAKLAIDFTSADLWPLLGMKKNLRMTC